MSKRAARRAESPDVPREAAIAVFDHFAHANRLCRKRSEDKPWLRSPEPKNESQRRLLESIDDHPLTVALGPAGTGKTYLAIACAVEALMSGKVERIVLSRPAVDAGEDLGYLPGDANEKLAPYLRPLYDALGDRLGTKKMRQLLSEDLIEIAPIAYMRGRTLSNAFIVVDEAQNCTYGQIKMLLTRLGWRSTMVLTGDPEQSDLAPAPSGLAEAARRLEPLDSVGVVRLTREDVVRPRLVQEILGVL